MFSRRNLNTPPKSTLKLTTLTGPIRTVSSLRKTMALKEKNQPTVTSPAPSTGVGSPGFGINPEIDVRLTKYMAENPEITAHYTNLVKEHPDRVIRRLSLGSMLRREERERQIERQMPQVKQWVAEHPGLGEQIEAKIRTTNPLRRMGAFIAEAVRAKARIDFAPKNAPSTGTGMSI